MSTHTLKQHPWSLLAMALMIPAHFLLMGLNACEPNDADGDDWTIDQGDCNDEDATIYPGATEVCDGVDQSCDGNIDEGVTITFYEDKDHDGYGSAITVEACSVPDGYAEVSGDCNDTAPGTYPDAREVCDGADQDCDGVNDNGVTTTYYVDMDGDGFGNPASTTQACSAPEGYTGNSGDCNDQDAGINPTASEICDGIDQDCDTLVDEAVKTQFFVDADADGFGDPDGQVEACSKPAGYSGIGGDCDDTNATIYPGATEVCDGADQDCDGTVDEEVTTTYYFDEDGDGYGDTDLALQACSAPEGYVVRDGDCDDEVISTYPDAVELSNGVDDDCDGIVDDVSFVPDVAAGYSHSMALQSDGSVYTWGDNFYGQLGNGTNTSSSVPIKVLGLNNIIGISAGGYFSLALRADGTVWAWGYNTDGELGNGTTTASTSPVQVSGLNGVVSISAGGYHALAVRFDGLVKAWGYNYYGQLGDGSYSSRNTPVTVSTVTDVSAISGGWYFSVARTFTGNVYTWGANNYGQLGDGTLMGKNSPQKNATLSNISIARAGGYHVLALTSSGSLYGWGYNINGQVGDGTLVTRTTPVLIPTLSGVKYLSAGYTFSQAIKSDNTGAAWGANAYGQLGDGTVVQRSTPVAIKTLTNLRRLSGGGYHALAILSDNTKYGWGYNNAGQVGDGTKINRNSPVTVATLP